MNLGYLNLQEFIYAENFKNLMIKIEEFRSDLKLLSEA